MEPVNENSDQACPSGKLKQSDPQVKYTDKSSNPSKHRCGICVYLLKGGKDNHGHYECGIVEGAVQEEGGCKLFDSDLIRAATDKMNLLNHPPTS